MNGQFVLLGSRTNPVDDYRYQLDITPEGAIPISGAISAVIGSVSIDVDSVYVQSGTMFMASGNAAITEEVPTAANKNNAATSLTYITSGTSTGLTAGSEIGTIVKFIGTGSYVQDLTYVNNNLTNVGSWY